MSQFEVLTIRKVPDRSTGTRHVRFDPDTGDRKLVNPATPGEDHEPWPLAGITIEGEPPEFTSASTGWVDRGIAEGWIRRIGERAVVRPGGPPSAPMAKTHTFVHCDRIVLRDMERGEVIYRVTRNPDKYFVVGEKAGYPVEEYGSEPDTDLADTEVIWFYEMQLDDTNGAGGGPPVGGGVKAKDTSNG